MYHTSAYMQRPRKAPRAIAKAADPRPMLAAGFAYGVFSLIFCLILRGLA